MSEDERQCAPTTLGTRDFYMARDLMAALARYGLPSLRVAETARGFEVERPGLGTLRIYFEKDAGP